MAVKYGVGERRVSKRSGYDKYRVRGRGAGGDRAGGEL